MTVHACTRLPTQVSADHEERLACELVSAGPLQFPRLMVSQRVDHVSLPQPDWSAASLDYVGPSNGKLVLSCIPIPALHTNRDRRKVVRMLWSPVSQQWRCMLVAGLETSLQKIFQEVLKKERLSVTANFFAEGGSQAQVYLRANA